MNTNERLALIRRSGVLPHSFFSCLGCVIFNSTGEGEAYLICDTPLQAELITACLNSFFLH